MTDLPRENVMPPADVKDGLTVRCPVEFCHNIILQAWRADGEVYFHTAHLASWCQPKVVPFVPASCDCDNRAVVHRISTAALRKVTPHKGRRGVDFAAVEFF